MNRELGKSRSTFISFDRRDHSDAPLSLASVMHARCRLAMWHLDTWGLSPTLKRRTRLHNVSMLKNSSKLALDAAPTRSRQSFPGYREKFLHAKMVQKGGPHKKINDKKNNAPFAPKNFLTREICLENRVPSSLLFENF